MSATLEYSIVVPVYNSSGSLRKLNEKLQLVLDKLSGKSEIIYVDDSSADDSWNVLEALQQANDNIRIIRLSRNFGQFESSLCGIEKAQGKIIITIDDDLQFNPDDIFLLQEHMLNNDLLLVYGIPGRVLQGNVWFVARNKMLNFILAKSYSSSFKIFRREIILSGGRLKTDLHFEAYEKHYLAARHKGYVKVPFHKREVGRSSYNFIKKLRLLVRYFFDYFPALLNPFYYLGFMLLFAGLVAVLLSFRLELSALFSSGFILALIIILAGLFSIGLAVTGSYLVRIMSQNRGVKYVVIDEK